jgi:hypothetical protein
MMIRRLAFAALPALALATPAFAQFYNTQPQIYGHPEYGTRTTGPNGQTYTTTPNIYGQPQFGTTTRGSNGGSCQTTPNIYGQPQFGTHTTCN